MPTSSNPETKLPVHSPIDNRLLGWLPESKVPSMIKAGRARLVRDRKGRLRRIYLSIDEADEYNPQIWDLMNRMSESRKTIYREVVNAAEHKWVWSHKLRGADLEAAARISLEELRADGIIQ